jgi:hypothetical protein
VAKVCLNWCGTIAIELPLIESGSLPQQGGGVWRRAVLFKVGEALVEGQVLG